VTRYESKTVRIHLEDRGQYCYLLLTRFDGEDHLLGENGWGGEYIRYTTMSRNREREDAITGDPFALVRQNEWLEGTPAEAFMKDLHMGRIEWSEIDDEMKLAPEDIDKLAGRTDDQQEADA
jgi:hypothetical protein